jgi:hypothetical protein
LSVPLKRARRSLHWGLGVGLWRRAPEHHRRVEEAILGAELQTIQDLGDVRARPLGEPASLDPQADRSQDLLVVQVVHLNTLGVLSVSRCPVL